ncbi:GNAT family N-acetyltransferase [Kribbella sp. CA-293567]|uniref:GNAT family N-acetyltransferase n=1 Tax=Kribbella sp. CA-293567 TaxID=3002436 RepID=UPI0022DD4862|nr:GNAT family N-acetyltransferase [Kribbella sp. CA-293567]WBQ04684.1 GNAT family N-acetyltransferase [Kribbella sp. CA-293567]
MASPAIRIRTTADLETCVRLLAEVHEASGYPVNWPADPVAWLSPWEALGCWVVTVDDEVVGHLIVTAEGAREALVERLFVEPRRTGSGLGRLLLEHAVTFARSQGRHLLLDVVASRDGAAGFYRKAGWQEIARTPIDWAGDQASELIRFSAPPLSS